MRNDIEDRKDEILNWINDKVSKKIICENLSCKNDILNEWLKKMNIIYNGNQNWSKDKILKHKWKKSEEFLYYGSTIKTHTLKNLLIRDRLKERKCEICGNQKWNGMDIPIELHHIDGDKNNNILKNLQIICPNCHAQTENHAGKGIKKSETKSNIKKFYCDCGKEIKRYSKNCQICDKKNRRKVERPSLENLLKDVSETSFVSVSKKYNVSDNTIRNWIKFYERQMD